MWLENDSFFVRFWIAWIGSHTCVIYMNQDVDYLSISMQYRILIHAKQRLNYSEFQLNSAIQIVWLPDRYTHSHTERWRGRSANSHKFISPSFSVCWHFFFISPNRIREKFSYKVLNDYSSRLSAMWMHTHFWCSILNIAHIRILNVIWIRWQSSWDVFNFTLCVSVRMVVGINSRFCGRSCCTMFLWCWCAYLFKQCDRHSYCILLTMSLNLSWSKIECFFPFHFLSLSLRLCF